MKRRLALIIPVLSNFKGCVEALSSIRTIHDWTPIIIPQWRNQVALSAAWNIGLLEAKNKEFDYCLVINDDILFSRYTIDNLVGFLENCDPNIIMVTGCNVAGAFPDNPYDILSWEDDRLMEENKDNFSEHPDFSCFMVRQDFIQKIKGVFDENFFPAFFEDNSMHYTIQLLGYKAGATASAPYYHFGSVTGNTEAQRSEEFHKQFRKNREYYIGKWGGEPGYETWQHPWNNSNLAPADWIPNNG